MDEFARIRTEALTGFIDKVNMELSLTKEENESEQASDLQTPDRISNMC